jgi:chromosome segregation ATPase
MSADEEQIRALKTALEKAQRIRQDLSEALRTERAKRRVVKARLAEMEAQRGAIQSALSQLGWTISAACAMVKPP